MLCTYDRPGLVWSDVSGLPNDAGTISDLLHSLTENAGVEKPFVLAAHSFGGLIARVYADKYPEDVAGLAFLDVSHPDQNDRMGFPDEEAVPEWLFTAFDVYASLGLLHVFNPTVDGEMPEGLMPPEIGEQFMAYFNGSKLPAAVKAEYLGYGLSLDAARQVTNLGDIPIVVVVAGEAPLAEDIPAVMNKTPEQFMATALELQKEIAALSSVSELFVVPEADHGTLVMDKDITIKTAEYIRRLIQKNTH